MKSNWSVYNNRLVYSGVDFLGYVEPFVPKGLMCGEEYNYNYVKYRTWIYEGDGSETRRDTPIQEFLSLERAIDSIEMFFELSIEEQRSQFETLVKQKKN